MNYNLLEEPWIPVLYNDGVLSRVGILDAFAHASRIRQIAAGNPMDRLAILRFLLALLYWCQGNPPDEPLPDPFPLAWFNKLHDRRDCFNLLGDGKRFYQARPRGKDKRLPANYLAQEVPTGTNLWHFRHATDQIDGLCRPCCAMGLLRLPLFATSGGRGKPPGINAKPPIYVLPLGSSLEETLRLSWRRVSNLGAPAWENPDSELPKTGEAPFLTGLTWLPRRVWLDTPDQSEAKCVSCGRTEPLIRQCVFAGTGSRKTQEDSQRRIWSDPHTVREGEDVLKPSDALDAPDAAAGQWAKTLAAITEGRSEHRAYRLWVVAFATVQNDKYLEAREHIISLPSAVDEYRTQGGVARIRSWQKKGRKLAMDLLRILRPTKSSHKKVPEQPRAMVDAIRPHIESQVSAKAGELIAAGDEAWEKEAAKYRPMMAALAKSLSPGYTIAALERRRQIERVKPNMRSHAKAPEKAGATNGGNR